MKKNTKRAGRNASRIEDLEARQMMSANFDNGININVSSTDVRDKGIPVMKAMGIESVRVWISPEFDKRNFEGSLQRAIDYSNAGFDVMLIVNPEDGKVYSQSQVKTWFQWALSNSSLKKAVDRWQVGNEVDADHYWKGSLQSYVTNLLKPASEALRAAGEEVVSGSVSWNPQDVQTMINAGMLNYTDYVGFHPYANGVGALKQRVKEINDIVNGRKPIVASEWNVRGYEDNKTAWAAAVEDAYPIIRAGFDINYYFALLNTTATKAGPGGIMNASGSKTSFYTALMNGKGGSTPDDGNEPSARPTVSKVSVYNDDTGQLLIDSLQSGDEIDLSKTTSRNISFVAVTAAGTSSVKLTLGSSSVTDNSATFELVQSLYAGSYTLNATPYSADNAGGTKGTARSFSFTVKNSPSTIGTPAPTPETGSPAVTAFVLYDADTDRVIKTINNGDTIDLATIGAKNLAVVATTSGSASSVKLTFDGKSKIENNVPYALFTEGSGGDLQGGTLSVGTHTLKGQAFSKDNAAGTAGASKSITFYVKKSTTVTTPPPASTIKPAITGISLVDAKTGKVISGYENISGSKWIKLSSLPTRNVKVVFNANSSTGSVKIQAAGKTKTDNSASYESDAFHAWAGTYLFTGTAYGSDNAAGVTGNKMTVTVKFY